MFLEKERNIVTAIINSSISQIILLAHILNTKIFTIQIIINRTHKNLLRVSVPYLPCINIINLCIKFRIVIALSISIVAPEIQKNNIHFFQFVL